MQVAHYMENLTGFFDVLKDSGQIETDTTCEPEDAERVLLVQGMLVLTCKNASVFALQPHGHKLRWHIECEFTYPVKKSHRSGRLNIPYDDDMSDWHGLGIQSHYNMYNLQKSWHMTCGRAEIKLSSSGFEFGVRKTKKETSNGKIRKIGDWQGAILRTSSGSYRGVDASIDILRRAAGVSTVVSWWRPTNELINDTLEKVSETCATLQSITERVCAWTCLDDDFKSRLRASKTAVEEELDKLASSAQNTADKLQNTITEATVALNKRRRIE